MRIPVIVAVLGQVVAVLAALPAAMQPPTKSAPRERVWPSFLRPCEGGAAVRGALCGTLRVFEDRAGHGGRKIPLNIVVLCATGPDRQPDPVFYLAGGPGQAATTLATRMVNSWMRERRDIVLVDQRGTGQSNPLRIRLRGDDNDVQGFLEPMFDVATFRRAKDQLAKIADLTKYTSPIAMDDLNEVRQALGYDKINLVGGSYGTRAALVYIRRHPETVRCAILTGVAPIAFKNPLFHAKAAQEGFDTLVAECKDDPRYAVYAELDAELAAVLARLREKPARVSVRHPTTGAQAEVTLTRDAFAEALRVLMYYMDGNRQVPLLVHRAFKGDYAPFAAAGIRSNRNLRRILAFGMLMSVVGSEDIPRITEHDIQQQTAGTFLGDARVRAQMAVARIWPRSDVPESYGEPVRGDMPVLFLSGSHDPVTPPRWGAEAARHFPNGVHVVVPAAHGIDNPAITKLERAFLDRGHAKHLDTSTVTDLRMPPLALPVAQPRRRVIR